MGGLGCTCQSENVPSLPGQETRSRKASWTETSSDRSLAAKKEQRTGRGLLLPWDLVGIFLSPDHGLRKAKKPKKKTKKRRHKSVRSEGASVHGPAVLGDVFARLPACPSRELTRRALGSYRTVPRARQTLRRKLARRVMRKNQNRTRTGTSGGQSSLTAPQALESRRRR